MTSILILGGTGYTGKLVARHLLEQSDVTITIASRHPEKAKALTDLFNGQFSGNRVKSVYADAAKKETLIEALRGHSMIIVAAPTTAFAENVAGAALEAGTDYLDVQFSPVKWGYLKSITRKIDEKGLCFITEAGFHPGLPSALVRLAATQFDTLETAITAGYLNMGKDLPWSESVDELIEGFKEYQAQIYENGQWTNPGKFKMRKIDFGNDIGRKTCYSMFFEELQGIPEMYPSIKETGFYMSESHWMTDWVIMPITFLLLKIFPNAVRTIGKFVWWGMGTFHKEPYRVELQVQATGIINGKPGKFTASVSHPDGYELTAIPVVATLLQYIDGTGTRPGLWMMGHITDPIRLMKDMERMGIKVEMELKTVES